MGGRRKRINVNVVTNPLLSDDVGDFGCVELDPLGDEVGKRGLSHGAVAACTLKSHPHSGAIDAEEGHISAIHLDRGPHLFDGESHSIIDTACWPRLGIQAFLRSIT